MLKTKHLKIDAAKLVIILLSCSSIRSQGQGQSSCMHNQFRCSTNGQCLQTEALCNGRRDCSNGEDEKGTRGWNCRSQVLTRDICDAATQFRCRFGGCIARTSLCDGRSDCWGGGDEAWDICSGGKPVIPQVSGGSRPVIPPPQTIQRPTPAPTQRPRPQLTTQPPPPPPNRSQFPSQSSSSSSGSGGGGGAGDCGPIREDPSKGFDVVCENSRFYPVDCADAPQGASAVYSCKPYFIPTSSLVVSGSRTCESGQWTSLNNKFSCEADCGISVNDAGAFIVGGSKAKEGKWPWMVALYEKSSRNSNKLEFICGGSLISARAVVTAAHCVVRRDSGQTKSFGNLKIVMGKYFRSYDRQSTGEQERNVAEVYVNPDYNRVTLNSDIAIIKLSEPVQITETVRPVCLPQSRDYAEPGQFGTLVGWGRGNGKSFQDQLQQAQLPKILNQKCIDAHPQFAHLVHQGTFCAGYRNGTSACDGDSGGPLVFRDRVRPSKYLLHGVVSAGIAASDGRSGCNPDYYTVFTDVGHHIIRRWIGFVIDNYFRS